MKKNMENSFVLLSLVAIVAITGIVALSMFSSPMGKLNSQENIAGDASYLQKPTLLVKPVVKDSCCLGHDGVFYEISSAYPEQLCKDDYQGQLVDLKKCDKPDARETLVCCMQSDSMFLLGYGMWIEESICEQLPQGVITSYTEEDCGDLCVKHDSVIEVLTFAEFEVIGGEPVPAIYCE